MQSFATHWAIEVAKQMSLTDLFTGLCHLALCFIGTIVYLVIHESEECGSGDNAKNINDVIECVLLASMVVAAIWVNIMSLINVSVV